MEGFRDASNKYAMWVDKKKTPEELTLDLRLDPKV